MSSTPCELARTHFAPPPGCTTDAAITPFGSYARNTGGELLATGFVSMLQGFDVCPTFISKKEAKDQFRAACGQISGGVSTARTGGGGDRLPQEAFPTLLALVARQALSRPPFSALYSTPLSKAEVILDLWGMGDATKIRQIQREKRFAGM